MNLKLTRTQEFVLRWPADEGRSYREVVRQQFNFSAPDTTRENEDYVVELEGVTSLECYIIPDISGGTSRALLPNLDRVNLCSRCMGKRGRLI